MISDRVGIGWRVELAAGILSHLDRIDVVEVIADDLVGAPARRLRALRTLGAQVPLVAHGISLGLASAAPVSPRRLDELARVVAALEPQFWSEHLAFVRAGGLEIGHLAAPPRTEATIEGAARNIQRAGEAVGAAPLIENVATLIDPPGSQLDEATWTARVQAAAGCPLLLDLNNLYANATNFGFDARAFLHRIPLDQVRAIHLAGGKWIDGSDGRRRLLDDHLHAVPPPVYELLADVGALTSQPLTVILERDGAYPPFSVLLDEIEQARAALLRGRARARSLGAPVA